MEEETSPACDPNGSLVEKTDAKNRKIRYICDDTGWPEQISASSNIGYRLVKSHQNWLSDGSAAITEVEFMLKKQFRE
ncbi:MAG: hypothetical protein ACQETG_04520 [Thermodesulfobacteriota bacterium]